MAVCQPHQSCGWYRFLFVLAVDPRLAAVARQSTGASIKARNTRCARVSRFYRHSPVLHFAAARNRPHVALARWGG